MITTGTEVAIIKVTIFGKINNGNYTAFYLVKINHLKLFPVAIKKYLSCRCNNICDTNKYCPKVVRHAQTLFSTLSPKGAYALRVLL